MFRIVAALATLVAAPAMAQGPLGSVPINGPKTQVMTLGSMHLSEHAGWSPAMLEPLLAKLSAFAPDVVTIEGLSGQQCAALKLFPDVTGRAYSQYCWNPDEIIADTRLSVPQAALEIRQTLAAWPKSPTASQRRKLALLFLAAGERASARVQWLRLAPAERRAADGLTDKMIEIITRKGRPMNESYEVAAVLAARLGHERVHAVDDHTSDAIYADVPDDYYDDFENRGKEPALVASLAANKAQIARVVDGATLLDVYREMNSPDGVKNQVLADFGGALVMPSKRYAGRTYVGWWDVRNLRMVANARAAFATRPGARVLNIVGSSHKPWYDVLFATMPDVEVVDAAAVLR
ncbi:hypothetical protein H9L13_09670 [Sphingomonas lutea]|uniref:TraB/GumN family protein n=1 Tax=Sphingomonas lutea TaxID=1045317 RepID=A0A7G9SGD8_9SPHN|nr:DUF5694 domain-containing protein [Sphingomonas lutea]QNN66913.1 hypothetical protein H9L13_09670 [Sphingomonas lutea]